MKTNDEKQKLHINRHCKTINEKSNRQEAQIAKALGGRPVIGERIRSLFTLNHEFFVSEEDYKDVSNYNWFSNKKTRYIIRHTLKGETYPAQMISLQRHLMGVTDPKVMIDHKDRNPLHNWRSNLRVCNNQLNSMNKPKIEGIYPSSSKYKGVRYNKPYKNKKRIKYWSARVRYLGKEFSLGYYLTEEEAALAYNKKAFELYGAFAYLNEVII